MKSPPEIRQIIAHYYPPMTDEQAKTAPTTEIAVYTLARLLLATCETYEAVIVSLMRRIAALEGRDGVSTQHAPIAKNRDVAPSAAVAASPLAPDDPGAAAAWVMGGIDSGGPGAPTGGPDPFAGDPLPQSPPMPSGASGGGGGGGVIPLVPAAGNQVLPPEVMAEMQRAPAAEEQPSAGVAAPPAAPTPMRGGKKAVEPKTNGGK